MATVTNMTIHFELHPGEVCTLKADYDQTLLIESANTNNVWMTCKGDLSDYWLAANAGISLRSGDEVTLSVEPSGDVAHISRFPKTLTERRPSWRNAIGAAYTKLAAFSLSVDTSRTGAKARTSY